MEFKTLYHRGSKGVIYSWCIWTEGSDIVTEYGQVYGKKQIARKTAVSKNIGKINETSPEEQARLEAESMWTFKRERKYYESQKEAENEEIFLPMLASDFEKRKGKKKDGHTYPCDIQPKLDGVRCLAFWEDDTIKLMSRGGKYYNCPHISTALMPSLPKNWVLDGELYIHGKSFQTITSWVKKFRPETKRIQYHVYDCVLLNNRNASWFVRWKELSNWYYSGTIIQLVETLTASSEEDVYRLQSEFVRQGYEGAIVRCNDNSAYKFGYRSKRLLKVKRFIDEEFQVVDYTSGKGKFEDSVIWICEAENGKRFRVVSKGTMEERENFLQNADNYIGQLLKVKFFERTDEGLPRFPVGIGFRIPEDI